MSKKTLRERLEGCRPTPSEEAAASRLRSAARERLRSAVEAIDHRERALTDGELDEFAVLLEARAETGYDFERMESMPAADFDRLVRMILRRRRKAADREATIPPDKRTKPLTKKQAAKLLGRHGDENRAVEWLNACIEDGIIRWEKRSRQSGIYHRDDFPAEVQDRIRP